MERCQSTSDGWELLPRDWESVTVRRMAGLHESWAFIGSDGRVVWTGEATPSFGVEYPPSSARSEYLQMKTYEHKHVSLLFSLFLSISLH